MKELQGGPSSCLKAPWSPASVGLPYGLLKEFAPKARTPGGDGGRGAEPPTIQDLLWGPKKVVIAHSKIPPKKNKQIKIFGYSNKKSNR